MTQKHQIIIEQDENGIFTAEVVGLPACYTQAPTIPLLLERLHEVTQGSLELFSPKHQNKAPIGFSMHINYA